MLRAVPHRITAFSLVELSIVLVILGLLVGGVLTGQSLIRASQIRAIMNEKEKYTTAVLTFRDKYFSLPGDMPNAFQFWGSACGTNTVTASTGCNGDGDGIIDNGNVAEMYEGVLAWEHLSRAGIVEGAYDGTGTVHLTYMTEVTSTNVPASKFSNGHWNLSRQPGEGVTSTGLSDTSLALGIGGLHPDWTDEGWVSRLESLTLSEAYNIDRKIDDGRSNSGMVSGFNDGSCADNGANDPYSIGSLGAETKNLCLMTFIIFP